MLKVILAVAIVTIAGLFIMKGIDDSGKRNSVSTFEVVDSSLNSENLVSVSISGEVLHPSTYEISPQSSLQDLIALAGGTTEKADPDSYTPGLIIGNRSSFYIAKLSEDQEACRTSTRKKVNINTASKEELKTVMKESQADALVNYRNANGKFACLEDVKKVSGIGDKTFLEIRDLISLT